MERGKDGGCLLACKDTSLEEWVGDSGITVGEASLLPDMTGDVTTFLDLPFLVALGMLDGNEEMNGQLVFQWLET